MIIAIMQPYFFPYIGYFQLMKAVDLFVFYDDAQYMKGGWINRNRILLSAKASWLTLPVKRDTLSLLINQRSYVLDEGIEPTKRKLHAAYAKAPAFAEAFPFLCELLDFQDANVAAFNVNLLRAVASKLGIRCKFAVSSSTNKSVDLHGEAKVIDLCQRIGADHYVNAIGGVELYNPSRFDAVGLQLAFLRTIAPPLQLPSGPQHLSIVHALMQDGFEVTRTMLDEYELLDKGDVIDTRLAQPTQ